MLFSQIEFIYFFAAVLAFIAVVRHHRLQKLFLLGASYVFYGYWDPRFLVLIIISTLVDFTAGQGLKRSTAPRARRFWLLFSLIINLGILCYFKYLNFFIDSMNELLGPLGWRTETLNIILPIGISFYTFQTLSYTIDVYRRHLEPCDDPWDFALFVAFFPQLVAGPIVRARHFLPQLVSRRTLSWDRALLGFRQFSFGFIKKVFIADRIGVYVDMAIADPGALDTPSTWLMMVAYAVQVYGDFSGYSDMAIGVARVLGFDLTENFRHPYSTTNLGDYWRRWHITLSSWLRDYLYFPLGGNRGGALRTYFNLLVTMLLIGLWHGASWTFVMFGAYHGVGLAITRWVTPYLHVPEGGPRRVAQRAIGWLITACVVTVGWVLFRSQSLPDAATIIGAMFGRGGDTAWYPSFPFIAIGITFATHMFKATEPLHHRRLLPHDRGYTPVILILALIFVYVSRAKGYIPFIYFQF